MVGKDSPSRKMFLTVNYFFLFFTSLICIFPFINMIAISFSSSSSVAGGMVKLWPVDFTLKSYEFVLSAPQFFRAFLISIERVLLGVPINMLLTVMVAYPLSKEHNQFRARSFFVWFFLITILFSGGLIPSYMTVKMTGLMDKIWALIIPSAVPVFNIILLMNFFRGLPKEIEEAAFIDGAGHWTSLWKIYLPLSTPALATITLFTFVGHWNAWFDGLIYINSPIKLPLQSYLQTIIVAPDIKLMSSKDLNLLSEVNDRTQKAAQIFIAMIPVLCIYPFMQRFFMKGIVLGSVKG